MTSARDKKLLRQGYEAERLKGLRVLAYGGAIGRWQLAYDLWLGVPLGTPEDEICRLVATTPDQVTGLQ